MSGILNSLKNLAASSASSSRRSSVDDKSMRFSLNPYPSDSGFNQWLDAMKMVARLPEGIPPDFRKKLWTTLAERHLESRGVNWEITERSCFNDWSNPDDNELGVQIVKDLHRTGCSLFCGSEGEENQPLLKRVLLAYARWNKSVGYCQGFNMLAALILLVVERSETDAVKIMIYLIEGVLPESYFADNLRGLSVDMAVVRDLLRLKLPKLSKHLDMLQNDAKEGSTYEPPLTNVFTMQWFLTLFCNCLPQNTVLRVWDLIFLEGNEILLRTALAIWSVLSDRIMAVNSADEFYSIMGVLTREMLEFGIIDPNELIKSIVMFEVSNELPDLRDKYLYNITPWAQTMHSAAKKGMKFFYSDDDEDHTGSSDIEEKMAITSAYGMGQKQRKENERRSSIQQYAYGHPDREKLALDISVLKQQYEKLRERQRQAHIIFSAACSRQTMGPTSSPGGPIAINHLLLGKNSIINLKGRRLGPPQGSIPPVRKVTRTQSKQDEEHVETLLWKDAEKRRYSLPKKIKSEDSIEEISNSDDESSSSTSTELCDDNIESDIENIIQLDDIKVDNNELDNLNDSNDNQIIFNENEISKDIIDQELESKIFDSSNDNDNINNLFDKDICKLRKKDNVSQSNENIKDKFNDDTKFFNDLVEMNSHHIDDIDEKGLYSNKIDDSIIKNKESHNLAIFLEESSKLISSFDNRNDEVDLLSFEPIEEKEDELDEFIKTRLNSLSKEDLNKVVESTQNESTIVVDEELEEIKRKFLLSSNMTEKYLYFPELNSSRNLFDTNASIPQLDEINILELNEKLGEIDNFDQNDKLDSDLIKTNIDDMKIEINIFDNSIIARSIDKLKTINSQNKIDAEDSFCLDKTSRIEHLTNFGNSKSLDNDYTQSLPNEIEKVKNYSRRLTEENYNELKETTRKNSIILEKLANISTNLDLNELSKPNTQDKENNEKLNLKILEDLERSKQILKELEIYPIDFKKEFKGYEKQKSLDYCLEEGSLVRFETGRRNSEIALKIIQENSLILNKLLQYQNLKAKINMRELSINTSISEDDEKLVSKDLETKKSITNDEHVEETEISNKNQIETFSSDILKTSSNFKEKFVEAKDQVENSEENNLENNMEVKNNFDNAEEKNNLDDSEKKNFSKKFTELQKIFNESNNYLQNLKNLKKIINSNETKAIDETMNPDLKKILNIEENQFFEDQNEITKNEKQLSNLNITNEDVILKSPSTFENLKLSNISIKSDSDNTKSPNDISKSSSPKEKNQNLFELKDHATSLLKIDEVLNKKSKENLNFLEYSPKFERKNELLFDKIEDNSLAQLKKSTECLFSLNDHLNKVKANILDKQKDALQANSNHSVKNIDESKTFENATNFYPKDNFDLSSDYRTTYSNKKDDIIKKDDFDNYDLPALKIKYKLPNFQEISSSERRSQYSLSLRPSSLLLNSYENNDDEPLKKALSDPPTPCVKPEHLALDKSIGLSLEKLTSKVSTNSKDPRQSLDVINQCKSPK